MRQVLDMLVWLAMIVVVCAVVYFTPRFAHAVAALGSRHGEGCQTCRETAVLNPDTADAIP